MLELKFRNHAYLLRTPTYTPISQEHNADASIKQAASRSWEKFNILTFVHKNHEAPDLHA